MPETWLTYGRIGIKKGLGALGMLMPYGYPYSQDNYELESQ